MSAPGVSEIGADASALVAAFGTLCEGVQRSEEFALRCLQFVDSGAQLFRIRSLSATETDGVVVVFEPSEALTELLAACAAINSDVGVIHG